MKNLRTKCTLVPMFVVVTLTGILTQSSLLGMQLDQNGGDASATTITKIVPLRHDVDAAAKKWQADAELVGVFALLNANGNLNLSKLAAPPNFDGGMLALSYRSSLAGEERTFNIESTGKWMPGAVVAINPAQEKARLGSGFMDLDEALSLAKSQGLKLPALGTPGRIDARLTAVRSEGGSNRTWQFSSVDLSDLFLPNVISQIFVSADSGQATTRDQADGVAQHNSKMESLARGRPLAKESTNFTQWKQAADDLMREYRPDMKLYEISLAVDYSNQRMTPKRAIYRYFGLSNRPLPDGEWHTAEVAVDGSFASLSEAATERRTDRFFPRPVPADVMSPEDALAKFWTMDLGVESKHIHLLLHHSGLTPMDVMRPAEPGADGPPDDPNWMPKDRWLWRTVAWRSQDVSTNVFRGERSVQRYLYVDASPAGSTAPPVSLLDSAIIGMWSRVPTDDTDAVMTMGIRSDGAYVWVSIGPGRPVNRGRFHAFNGRWTLVATNINLEDSGTYRFPTNDTLELVGRNDKFLFSLDEGTGVVANRKSDVEPRSESLAERNPKTPDPIARVSAPSVPKENQSKAKIDATFLATSNESDMNSFGGQPFGMAVCTGGVADHLDYRMTSEAGQAKVQFNGTFGPRFQVIEEVVVSSDGRHHGYFAMKNGRWSVVIDATVTPVGPQSDATDVILNGYELVFSEDSKRWAAVAKFLYERGGDLWEEHQVMVDGKHAAPDMAWVLKQGADIAATLFGNGFSSPRFSPNGLRFAYIRTEPGEVASKRTIRKADGTTTEHRFHPGKAYVIVDGVPGPEFEVVKNLEFSRTNLPTYFAKSSKGWLIVQPKSQSAAQKSSLEAMAFSPEGLGLAVTMFDKHLFGTGGSERVEVFSKAGNWKSTAFDEIKQVAMGPLGKPALIIGTRRDKYVVVIDGKNFGTFDYAGEAVVSEKTGRWSFVAIDGEKYFSVIDGIAGPKGDAASKAAFSADGTQCAYVLRDAAVDRLLVEGKERARARRIDGPVFSPDGSKLAYFQWADPDGWPSVVIDGKQISGFDRTVFSTINTRESAPEKPLIFEDANTVRFIGQRGKDFFSVSYKLAN